jgi:WD40 repeat protein
VPGHKDRKIIIQNVETGVIEKTLQGIDEDALSVQYSLMGHKIAAGFVNGKVILWNSVIGKNLLTFEEHTSRVYSI